MGKPENQREEKKGQNCSLQPDTPFLDRLGFGGGTGQRGSCAWVRVPLWNILKGNQRTKTKRTEKKQHKSVVERSRPDKIDNEKPSVGQFEQWHLVRSTRSNESCGNQKAVQTLKHDITVNYWDYGNTVFYSNKAMAWMRILLTVLWCAGHVRMCLQYLTRCLPSLS